MRFRKLTGLIAAPPTPMDTAGRVALERIKLQADVLCANGVGGAFVLGTTGEGLSLTLDERRAVAERWREVAVDRLKLIVHVGHTCVADSRALARHAAEIDADAFSAVGPCYFKPPDPAALTEFCAQVASGAADLPFYYYHIPGVSGVRVRICDLLDEAGDVPNFAGVKFTCEDLDDFGRCVEAAGGRYNMLFGRDEMLLAGLATGAAGAVGSTYNYAAPLYVDLIKAFEAGDLPTARRLQERSRQMIAVLRRFGGIPACKAIMKLIGVDCGPVRSPLRALDDSSVEALRAALDAIGFFDYACKVS